MRVALTLDAQPLHGDLAELVEALTLLEAKAQLFELLKLRFSASESLVELVGLDCEPLSAGAAGELRATAQLSDLGRDLLAAVRAGNVDLSVVEKAIGHLRLSVGGLDASTVGRPAGCGNPRAATGGVEPRGAA